jgi:hypothetical protein
VFLWGALAVLAFGGCTYYQILLEKSEIDLLPGEEKSVSVQGKKGGSAVCVGTYYDVLPEEVDVPKDKGVTAKVDGGKLIVSADKEAKPGTVVITLKASKAKEVTLTVNVRAK